MSNAIFTTPFSTAVNPAAFVAGAGLGQNVVFAAPMLSATVPIFADGEGGDKPNPPEVPAERPPRRPRPPQKPVFDPRDPDDANVDGDPPPDKLEPPLGLAPTFSDMRLRFLAGELFSSAHDTPLIPAGFHLAVDRKGEDGARVEATIQEGGFATHSPAANLIVAAGDGAVEGSAGAGSATSSSTISSEVEEVRRAGRGLNIGLLVEASERAIEKAIELGPRVLSRDRNTLFDLATILSHLTGYESAVEEGRRSDRLFGHLVAAPTELRIRALHAISDLSNLIGPAKYDWIPFSRTSEARVLFSKLVTISQLFAAIDSHRDVMGLVKNEVSKLVAGAPLTRFGCGLMLSRLGQLPRA